MKSLYLNYDKEKFMRMQLKKKQTKMNWEDFIYDCVVNANVQL